MYRSDKRLYVNADRSAIVPEDSPDAAELLVAVNGEIPDEVAERYGLKERPKPDDKMISGPEETKGSSESSSPSATEIFTSAQLEALQAAGFDSADKLENASDDELKAVPGIGDATVEKYREFLASR